MINSIETLLNSDIPEYVKEDCLHRINDWLSSDGGIEDNYVQKYIYICKHLLSGGFVAWKNSI